MKKIIITIAAIVLAGAATTGIVYYATHKDEDPFSKKGTKKDSGNEVTEIDPDDESKTKSNEAGGNLDRVGTDFDFGADGRNYVNFDDMKVKVNGDVITMNQSTVQDLVDTGCYVGAYMLDRDFAYDNQLDDPVETGDVVVLNVFDMDEETDRPEGKNWSCPIFFIARAETDGTIIDCVVCGVYYRPEFNEAWEDGIEFEFPFTITPEDLVANAGADTTPEISDDYAYYVYEYEDCTVRFAFYQDSLYSIIAEFDEGAVIDRGTIVSAEKVG